MFRYLLFIVYHKVDHTSHSLIENRIKLLNALLTILHRQKTQDLFVKKVVKKKLKDMLMDFGTIMGTASYNDRKLHRM